MTETNNSYHQKINWREIFIFYVIAVTVSAPFRLNLINLSEVLPLPYGLNLFYRVFRGIGPLVGFLVVVYLLKSSVKRQNTFFGLSKMKSVLAILIIPIGLIIIGVYNNQSLNNHYYGLITGFMLILYSLEEEYGWRGYLQEALATLPAFKKIILIAVLWYIWHLNFLVPGISLQMHIIHFLSLVLGSWGLLKVTESTYSILFAMAVHLSFNILSDIDADPKRKIMVVLASVLLWVVLIRSILKKKAKANLV
ncbi:MAG: CPBP family intramembrane glutamic endopeptidase [Bacteroidia bacterium]